MHEFPVEGYPISKSINSLLLKKTVIVYRGELHSSASELINEIDRLSKSFQEDFKIRNSSEIIKTYCKNLKNNVDIRTESFIEIIKNNQEEIINQIDLYEKTQYEEFHNIILECEKKHKIWVDFVNVANLNDNEIEVVFNEAKQLKNKLSESIKKFEVILLDKKKLIFFENLQKVKPKIIGVLSQNEFQSFNMLQCLIDGNPKSINFNNQKYNFNELRSCFAWEIELNKFCVIGMTFTETIKLKMLTIDGEILKEIEENSGSKVFGAAKLNNIFIVVNSSNIKTYSMDLLLIHRIKVYYEPTSVYVINNQIYVHSASLFRPIYIYKEDLSLIKKIEPIKNNGKNLGLYEHQSLTAIRPGKVFNLTLSKVTLFDFQTQAVLKDVEFKLNDSNINNYLIYPTSDDTFLIIHRSGEFRLFDFNQELMKFSIEDMKNILNFSISDNGTILIVDSKCNLKIYNKDL